MCSKKANKKGLQAKVSAVIMLMLHFCWAFEHTLTSENIGCVCKCR